MFQSRSNVDVKCMNLSFHFIITSLIPCVSMHSIRRKISYLNAWITDKITVTGFRLNWCIPICEFNFPFKCTKCKISLQFMTSSNLQKLNGFFHSPIFYGSEIRQSWSSQGNYGIIFHKIQSYCIERRGGKNFPFVNNVILMWHEINELWNYTYLFFVA